MRRRGRGARCREQPAGRRHVLHLLRQHGDDLGQGVIGGAVQILVAALGDEAQAEDQRIHLVHREHQRRQEEAGLENVPNPASPSIGAPCAAKVAMSR